MSTSLKLDELLVKKKEPVQILDLSKSTAETEDDLKKLLERVPDFKIKTDKVKTEDIRINDKRFTFKTPKKELKERPFSFMNPLPVEMKSLCLNDLCSIAIQWKMLTSLRPKNRLDEEYYSKLVELGKFQLSSREREKKIPLISYVRYSKNKAGVLETRVTSCRDCGEEFCSSVSCHQFAYDSFERENFTKLNDPSNPNNEASEQYDGEERKIKKVRKSKKRIQRKRAKVKIKAISAKNSSVVKSSRIGVKLQKKQTLRLDARALNVNKNNKIQKLPQAETKKKKMIPDPSSNKPILRGVRAQNLPTRGPHLLVESTKKIRKTKEKKNTPVRIQRR